MVVSVGKKKCPKGTRYRKNVAQYNQGCTYKTVVNITVNEKTRKHFL